MRELGPPLDQLLSLISRLFSTQPSGKPLGPPECEFHICEMARVVSALAPMDLIRSVDCWVGKTSWVNGVIVGGNPFVSISITTLNVLECSPVLL